MKKQFIAIAVVIAAIMPGLASAKASKKQISGHLNLNTASVEQLHQLPGVSPKKAQAIENYRKEHPFKSVDELDNVQGFSPKSIGKIKPYLGIDGSNNLVVEGGKSKRSKKTASEGKHSKSKKA